MRYFSFLVVLTSAWTHSGNKPVDALIHRDQKKFFSFFLKARLNKLFIVVSLSLYQHIVEIDIILSRVYASYRLYWASLTHS